MDFYIVTTTSRHDFPNDFPTFQVPSSIPESRFREWDFIVTNLGVAQHG
jgi:hypothetical protein